LKGEILKTFDKKGRKKEKNISEYLGISKRKLMRRKIGK